MKSSPIIRLASCRVKTHSGLSATLDNSVTRRATGTKHDELEAKHRLENSETRNRSCPMVRRPTRKLDQIIEDMRTVATYLAQTPRLSGISGGGASRSSIRPNRLVTMW